MEDKALRIAPRAREPGLIPNLFLKAEEKWLWLKNPTARHLTDAHLSFLEQPDLFHPAGEREERGRARIPGHSTKQSRGGRTLTSTARTRRLAG